MNLRNKIVSIGLLPIIITLIGLHFFHNTEMLGAGLLLSIIMLTYNITRMKDLNFFLLLGTLGIGTCFILRLFWGYKYVPLNTITPTLEFSLMVFAFIYYTAPELYNGMVNKLGIRNCFSYKLETKIIIILSSIHLILLYIIKTLNHDWSPEGRFFMINIIPVSIYIICLILNTIGIHIAAKIDLSRHNIIRIAPICNGKLFLSQKSLTPELLDIPIEGGMDGTIEDGKKYALKAVKKITLNNVQPRLILHYNNECSCGACNDILLFILPLKTEKDIMLDGKFFNFEDIEKNTHLLNPSIKKELEHLRNAASLWKDFYL
ncbi:hypothetical protein [Bacteroides caecigallinarum]|uniref:hypothetical protein n=1 Tax=Bacteroides caecigallinarum TaxID=1411144 RepID=UPI001F226648|nr:hypothetical protein [Bacteroides caecigallinarum]MCF2552163.1 hypothetical protein [Bacteroides caecigallinarum]